jgi:hypothetical protein
MLFQQASTYIRDFEDAIRRTSYDVADKRHIATIFADLRYLYADTHRDKTFNLEKHKQVSELQVRWQKSRMNPETHCGADDIGQILDLLKAYIPDLPTEYKSTVITIPAQQDVEADRLLATLKRRGVTLGASV